jgi:hypothetical protein
MYLVSCLRQLALEVRAERWTVCSVLPQAEFAVSVSLNSYQVLSAYVRGCGE